MQKNIIKIEHPRRHHMVGDGFRVSQYIPGYGREMSNDTSPFLMLDYNTPWQIPPQHGHRPGVGFHPHRGFETVTIVYSGEVEHQDTAGHGGVIGADEVQWMTAGSGLLHNEFMTENFSKTGGIQHVAQLWVNLPKEHKMTAPRYQALTRENIPEVEFDGGKVRVIAGTLRIKSPRHSEERRIQKFETLDPSYRQDDETIEQRGAAKTFSPVELYDIRFDSKGSLEINIPENYTLMLLVTEGEIQVNDKTIENGNIVHFSRSGTSVLLQSDSIAKVLVISGKPLDEPIVQYGPFVMNTEAEIQQAFDDFHAGKMGNLES